MSWRSVDHGALVCKLRGRVGQVKATARVNDEMAAEATFSFVVARIYYRRVTMR